MPNNNFAAVTDGDATIKIVGPCHVCGELVQLNKVPFFGFKDWREGMAIQLALPDLSADEREFLISGTCGACFDKLYSGWD